MTAHGRLVIAPTNIVVGFTNYATSPYFLWQTAEAGTVARVDCFPVGIEVNPVGFFREIGADGGMYLPGGSVGDKPQVPGVRVQGQGALVFPGESDFISVADGDDGAQLIGAEDGAVRVVQSGKRGIVPTAIIAYSGMVS